MLLKKISARAKLKEHVNIDVLAGQIGKQGPQGFPGYPGPAGFQGEQGATGLSWCSCVMCCAWLLSFDYTSVEFRRLNGAVSLYFTRFVRGFVRIKM